MNIVSEYMVYKYVHDDEIIYVGKTNSNIISRIDYHSAEGKFQPYLENCQIFYGECKNPAHTAILETYLINKYKPILNKSMKYDDNLGIKIEEPTWVLFKDIRQKREIKSKQINKIKFNINKNLNI